MKKDFILGFLTAIILLLVIWFGGYYYDTFYEVSTFPYDKLTPMKCSGWQRKWDHLLGSGRNWHCKNISKEVFNEWCNWDKSLDGEYTEKNGTISDWWFYKVRCV